MADFRFSTATARLVRVFLVSPTTPRYGFELMTAAELLSAELYPLLAQLERAHWIEGHWEPTDPFAGRKHPRRYYRLSANGYHAAQCAFASVGVRAAAPPPIRVAEPCGACRLLCPLAIGMLLLSRLLLPRGHRAGLYREWRGELDHLLRCGTDNVPRRFLRGIHYARGLFATASKISRDLGPCRTPAPADPLVLNRARRRLAAAEQARNAAVKRHEACDVEEDPVGEFLALHTVLFCQVELDDAQMAYRTAQAIEQFQRAA